MSTGKLVDPTYATGANDELAVVDVYKAGGGIVNSFQEKAAGAIDAADKVSGEKPSAMGDNGVSEGNSDDPLGDLIEGLENGEGIPVLDDISDTMGDFGGAGPFKGLAEDLAGGFADYAGGDLSAMTGMMDGMVDKLSNLMDFPEDFLNNGYRLLDVAKDLANGSSDVLSSLTDMPNEFTKYLAGGLPLDMIKNNVLSTVGDTIAKLTEGIPMDAILPLANILSNISGGNYAASIQNVSGLSALVSGASYLGSQVGLPNVFSTLSNSITDNNVLMAAARPLLQRAVHQGDTDLFKDIAQSTIGSAVTSIVPNAVGAFASAVQKPVTLAQQEYPRYYQGMRSAFDTVNADWATYARTGGDVVNAAVIGQNNFMLDLVRSQLNEVMHPNNYLSNVQQVYPESGAYTQSFVKAAIAPNTDAIITGLVLDSSNVEPLEDYDFFADTATDTTEAQAVLANTPTRITNFDNEPFLLLSHVFRDNSVQAELNRHFPEFAISMTVEPELTT